MRILTIELVRTNPNSYEKIFPINQIQSHCRYHLYNSSVAFKTKIVCRWQILLRLLNSVPIKMIWFWKLKFICSSYSDCTRFLHLLKKKIWENLQFSTFNVYITYLIIWFFVFVWYIEIIRLLNRKKQWKIKHRAREEKYTHLSIPSNEAGWITSLLSEFWPFCFVKRKMTNANMWRRKSFQCIQK